MTSNRACETPEINFLGDLQRLSLKPGDKFVLQTKQRLSGEVIERIHTMWERFAGPEVKLLVLDGDFRLGTISTENVASFAERA